jgi:hypothetical protein
MNKMYVIVKGNLKERLNHFPHKNVKVINLQLWW